MSAEEVEVLETAVENADRFYRVQWKGVGSSDADAEQACIAFKAVSEVRWRYFEMRYPSHTPFDVPLG